MATLKEVAERAGVSIATVSYCINGKKNLSPKTMLKVRNAIEELNYIPNLSARNLKVSTTDEIGVILPNLDDSTNSDILKGILSEADAQNMTVNIACTYNNPHNEQAFIKKYISKNYAGIILMTC
ncbi:MAG: LacI family transcriptional regulator, partial [Lachnospiraceae bacterium]|nr:LacI family transcriptional regulator [Lachnospiraceae bacterium]